VLGVESPASIAGSILLEAFQLLDRAEDDTLIVDFCSGGGGPVPIVEKTVNARRKQMGLKGVKFLMTDLRPNAPAWTQAVAKSYSKFLKFVPEPMDATKPDMTLIRSHLSLNSRPEHSNGDHTNRISNGRIIQTFHLSFHHFPDEIAKNVLKSAMETSSGFAILELQDRRLASVLAVASAVGLFTIFMSGMLLWGSPTQIFWSMVIPVIPIVMTWDGIVSCLRVREFKELMELIDEVLDTTNGGHNSAGNKGEGAEFLSNQLSEFAAQRGNWAFEGGRRRHLVFGGDVTWFIGRSLTVA
jgi:hypothetical protein